jgi:hypothetical protein
MQKKFRRAQASGISATMNLRREKIFYKAILWQTGSYYSSQPNYQSKQFIEEFPK